MHEDKEGLRCGRLGGSSTWRGSNLVEAHQRERAREVLELQMELDRLEVRTAADPLDDVLPLVGVGARARRDGRLDTVSWRELAVVGLVAHVVMLAMFVVVPFEGALDTLRRISIPVLAIYPLTFTLLGTLMVRRLQSTRLGVELVESEERYRTVFDSQHLPALVVDPHDGRIVDANRRAVEYYGWTRDELLEMTSSDLEVLPRDEVLRIVDDAHAAGAQSFELQHRLADGTIRDVEVFGSEIRIEGRVLIYAVMHDVTERNRAEEELQTAHDQLRQAQKMEAVGRLAGGIAHDFNNMLQVILGYAELALLDAPADSPQHERLAEIRNAATRSAELTKQLLAFARKQPIAPQVIDIGASTANTMRLLSRLVGEHISVELDIADELWPIRIDPAQLDQVLANLAVNARDAMHDGGRLLIELRNTVVDQHEVSDLPDAHAGPYVEIVVTDTGHGIDPAIVESIFEPFFTTKSHDQGSGLGLAIVYGIITQHDGFIRLDSEVDRGTSVRLYLPRVESEMTDETPSDARPRRIDGDGVATILLVEDEPSVLRLSETTLRSHGYRVVTAADGEAALRAASSHDGPIDLLVTDVVMPGLDGRAVAERLAVHRPDTPVLFVSGYTDDVVAARGVVERHVHLLTKPFTSSQLLDAVADLLAAGRADRGDT